MGCLSRVIVVLALLVQVAAAVLGMLVFGSAGVLGEAAIISAEDALIVFVLLAASLIATMILALKIWLGSRTRKQMRADLLATRASASRRLDPGAS
jgi:hypothetical protein